MAASSATSSLLLPSFSSSFSKTLIPFRPKTLILICSLSSSSSVSLSLATPLTPSPLLRKARSFRSAFVRNVAVSSDVEQEEEEEEEEEQQQQQQQASFSPDLKLFVGNLPFSVDSADLAGLFERAGNVEMVEVIYDKLTGKSRGFGFVTMSTVEEVEAAAQQFNGYELEGRALRVNSGPPPPRDDPPSRGFRSGGSFDSGRGFRSGDSFDSGRGFRSGGSFDSGRGGSRSGGSFDSANRVYVGNLSWGVEDSDLETMFSKKGKVVEAKVVYDRDSGRSRGFGFVTFRSAEEVESAISSLNGADLDGRPIRVTAAESRPRRQF